MAYLNKKDATLITKMLDNNEDMAITKAVSSLLIHLDKEKDEYIVKPVVIVSRKEGLADSIYSIVRGHIRAKEDSFSRPPEEIMADGSSYIEVLVNHCHDLRHQGPRFFYYKSTNAVLELFPDEFFFVIEIMDSCDVRSAGVANRQPNALLT